MKWFAGAVGLLTALVIAPFVLVVVAATGAGSLGAAGCANANLASILATIRSLESGGSYTAEARGSSASGAYQFVDGTWNNFGGYVHAADAPPEQQDQKAAEMVRSILASHGYQVSAVPVVWYLGHLPDEDSTRWDVVTVPGAGNVLTPREYQSRWLEQYEVRSSDDDGSTCAGALGSFGDLPDVLECSRIQWGGYENGEIPYSAMRYSPRSGFLHPGASATYDQLQAAAETAGLDLRGSGYRPASAGGNTAGTSCHGLGLAIDIDVLVVGERYPTAAAAFASDEFVWLCTNAEAFGWITPRWAIPKGMICGTVVGTGTGGNIGDQCCFLEPWHLEAASVVATPDFRAGEEASAS